MYEMNFEWHSNGVQQDLASVLRMAWMEINRFSAALVDRCSHVPVGRFSRDAVDRFFQLVVDQRHLVGCELGWEDVGVERRSRSGSEFRQSCPIQKVVSIGVGRRSGDDVERCLDVGVGRHQYELPTDIELSTRKASSSRFSCSSISPNSLSKMESLWCPSMA